MITVTNWRKSTLYHQKK